MPRRLPRAHGPDARPGRRELRPPARGRRVRRATRRPGQPSDRVYFALAGLYLALERGFTGREVQRAHMAMAKGDKRWPTFAPPAIPARTSVRNATPDDLRPWMADVWNSWIPEQARIRALMDAVLG